MVVRLRRAVVLGVASSALALHLPSQSPASQSPASQTIDDELLLRTLEVHCAALREGKQLVALDELRRTPPPASVELRLPAPRTQALDVPELYERARASSVIVGVYFQCTECDGWHFDGASGFTLAPDGVVCTCWHVLDVDPERRNAHVVVADLGGRVWPVTRVLAADAKADVCILATGMTDGTPLPLRSAPRVGERVVCLSHPDHRFAFFSEGRIARAFVSREPPERSETGAPLDPSKPPPPLPPGVPALEVTLDFAQGSSGAAILDDCGNAVCVAQATQTIVYETADASDVQMVVKIAAPAQAVAALVRAPK